jgi:hypothetical protein
MSLAQQVLVRTRGWAADSSNGRVRLESGEKVVKKGVRTLFKKGS